MMARKILILLVVVAMIPMGSGCKRQTSPSNAPRRDGGAAKEGEGPRRKKENEPSEKRLADREKRAQENEQAKQQRQEDRERLTVHYSDELVTESKTAAQASLDKVTPHIGDPKSTSLVFTFQDKAAKTLTMVTAHVDKVENGVFHGRVVRIDPKTSDSGIEEGEVVTLAKEDIVDWTLAKADGSAYGQFLLRNYLKGLIDGGLDPNGEAAKKLAKLGEPLPPSEMP